MISLQTPGGNGLELHIVFKTYPVSRKSKIKKKKRYFLSNFKVTTTSVIYVFNTPSAVHAVNIKLTSNNCIRNIIYPWVIIVELTKKYTLKSRIVAMF